MKLSAFILSNEEGILSDWDAFARSIDAIDSMDFAELRDHAQGILRVIASDLDKPRAERDQSDRAKGLFDADENKVDTPAQFHGEARAERGFTFTQMLSEYRALRTSVIERWRRDTQPGPDDLQDLICFHEAIDQSVAESAGRFAAEIEHTREVFLGILGHDLRTPLSAIVTSAQFMIELGTLQPPADVLTKRIASSGGRMSRMIDDLLEFTRGRLGTAVPVVRAEMDLGTLLEDAVGELRAAQPALSISLKSDGDLTGEWDPARLTQVFTNLLSNAWSHGHRGDPIEVAAYGQGEAVVATVRNGGTPIPPGRIRQLFRPMKLGVEVSRAPEHLGIGLYIVERIVSAHGGTVGVRSDADATTFTVSLPRRPAHRAEGIEAEPAVPQGLPNPA